MPETHSMLLVPPHRGSGPLTPAQLTRARLCLAWQDLTEVAEHADLLPTAARAHVAQALAHLCEAKALVERLAPADAEVLA